MDRPQPARRAGAGRGLTPEFALVAAGCRWPVDPAAIRAAADQPLDWDLVAATIRRHRVVALVWHALRLSDVAVPETAAVVLRAGARRIAVQNLAATAEMLRLDAAFANAGVDRLFVKGVTAGRLAYGDAGLKHGWDIDLLVARERLDAAAAVLVAAGYRPLPGYGAAAGAPLCAWHATCKESGWIHDDLGLCVELHTALADRPDLIPAIGMASARQPVEVAPGRSLPTLAGDEFYAYLCVHGTAAGWHRLKWLADVNALLARGDPAALHAAAEAVGAGRASAVALLLCRQLFAAPLPAGLAARLDADRWPQRLARLSLHMMVGGGTREPGDTALDMQPARLLLMLLRPGWRSAVREARRQLLLPVARHFPRVPPALRALALPLVLPRAVAKNVKRVTRSARRRDGQRQILEQ